MAGQGMECSIVVRRAAATDSAARGELVRRGFTGHDTEAFLLFFFQETTLQGVVLGGAVLFIFCGASWLTCALVVPLAALLVRLAVRATHEAAAHTHTMSLHREMFGYVAELRGPLPLLAGGDPRALRPRVVAHTDSDTETDDLTADGPCHKQVVGTVCVSECWGAALTVTHAGWLHDLHVHPRWRRRGVGLALLRAARRGAAGRGLAALHALTSELQAPARELLHEAGWSCRGSYHRPLLGSLLTLQMAQLSADLPLA